MSKMRNLSRIFKALSDENRIRILKMLEIRPLCVCEIKEVLRLANSTVSKHLSILRNAGLILDEKEGKWVSYSLNKSTTDDYIRKLLLLFTLWLADDEQVRKDADKVKTIDRATICRR